MDAERPDTSWRHEQVQAGCTEVAEAPAVQSEGRRPSDAIRAAVYRGVLERSHQQVPPLRLAVGEDTERHAASETSTAAVVQEQRDMTIHDHASQVHASEEPTLAQSATEAHLPEAVMATDPGPADEDGGFHTPSSASLHPERFFIGDGQAQCPSAGLCLCGSAFLPDSDFCRKCGARRLAAACSSCGSEFLADAEFCRKCGTKRSAAAAIQATATAASSITSPASVEPPGSLVEARASPAEFCEVSSKASPPHANSAIANGVEAGHGVETGLTGAQGWQDMLRSEKQELEHQLLHEQVSEAHVQAHLDAEMERLTGELAAETHAMNDVIYQIEGVGRLFMEELPELDVGDLQATLLNEEQSRQALEAGLLAEERELCGRVEAQERQLAEMAVSRECMEAHLRRMASMQAWIRGDIEDVRKTRTAVEVVGQRELEERSEESEQATREIHTRIIALRSNHDTWRAQAESEVFRLRQESKQQLAEEEQMAEEISGVQREQSEIRSELNDHFQSESSVHDDVTRALALFEQEYKHHMDAVAPLHLSEHDSLIAACQAHEKAHSDCLATIEILTRECDKVQSQSADLCNWEFTQASAYGGGRLPALERQEAHRLKSELICLDNELDEEARSGAQLHDELEKGQRGFLGFFRRRRPREQQLEVPPSGLKPPLPPPASAPVADLDRGPPHYRDR